MTQQNFRVPRQPPIPPTANTTVSTLLIILACVGGAILFIASVTEPGMDLATVTGLVISDLVLAFVIRILEKILFELQLARYERNIANNR